MTPTQAAKEIGCTPQYVRDLIRAGKIKAKKIESEYPFGGFHYEIDTREVKRIKNQACRSTRGRKRNAPNP